MNIAKKHHFRSLIFTLLMCFGLTLSTHLRALDTIDQSQQKNVTVNQNVILVLGDSLSAAYNIDLESGWVNLMRQRLVSKHPNTKVINASVGGATTSNGLQRLPSLLAKHNPRLVIIELGGNDGLQGKPIPYITRNLDQLLTKVKQNGAQAILVGTRLPPNFGPRYTDPFFKQFETLAKKHDAILVPFILEGVAGNRELMQEDGLHPRSKAQPIVLENIWPSVAEIFTTKEKG